MPAIVGVCGLRDVSDGQRFGRGHPVSQGEERYSNRACAKKSGHYYLPYVKQSIWLVAKADTARDLMGRC
jgi:hypothetical protein